MRFGLRMLQGAFAGRVLGLAQNQTVIMGRGSDTSVRLPDMSLSRRHCQLTNTPRGLLIAAAPICRRWASESGSCALVQGALPLSFASG